MPSKVKDVKTVEIPARLPVRDLAERLEMSPVDLLKALIANGVLATITQDIDYETAAIVAEDLGFNLLLEGTLAREAEEAAAAAEPVEAEPAAPSPPEIPWYIADEEDSDLEPRAPIVSVMGHVDHGKTTLLDTLRHTTVAAGESGGITQHIGAYALERDGATITFVDTPGHEAFTAMRARGAQTTDIAVIVVAADDGVMPQTREAVDHARAAGVPMVVAVNKTDLENAKPDRVLQQMADIDVVPDSWGGDTFFIPVSALTGEGLDELLDAILLVAEEAKPRANPRRPARGTILEGRVQQGRGVIASAIVQTGTLRTGDTIVTGTQFSRVRAMFDQSGSAIKEATPASPVEIMGLSDLPEAGARFEVAASDKAAKRLVAEREAATRATAVGPAAAPPITLDDLFARAEAGEAKSLNVVVKTDVQGTVEPVVSSLEGLSGAVAVSVLHAAAGDISESDVNLAAASKAVVIGFRVAPDAAARTAADRLGVEIRQYEVIYKLVEDVEDALTGMLEPEYHDVEIGRAEVRAVFHVPRAGTVAGCYITAGIVRRNSSATVLREGQEIADTSVSSLKRFTEDVREVREGFECGIGLAGFDDFKEGDHIAFTLRERVR